MTASGEGQMLSVVVPVYNEEDNIDRVHGRLRDAIEPLGMDWELIFALDPSTDRTEPRIEDLADRDPRVKMLRFSRRVGQPMATLAGMEAAAGDAVVVIDCDLQDPPELIAESSTAGVTVSTSSMPSAEPARGRRCPSASSRRSDTA